MSSLIIMNGLQSIIVVSIAIIILIIVILSVSKFIRRLKHAESQLNYLIAKQETMISNISDVIAIMDINGVISYKSPNLETQFGWKPEDIVGTSGFRSVHPNDQLKMQHVFAQLLSGEKQIVTAEFKYQCKDGLYKDVFLNAKNMFNDPYINGALLNYRDITATKKARDRLIDSEIKYRTLFERSIDIVCIVDNEGNILDVNNACIQFFGYSRNELLKMSISEFVYSEDKEKSDYFMQMLQKQGYYKMYEGRIITKTGAVKWIQVNSTEILKDGVRIGSQDLIRDITDKKEAFEKLKKLNATKDKFFSIISHDLRNPFISLIGFSELLLSRLTNKQYNKVEEFAEIINETAIQNNKLLTNLLDWSKLQRGSFRNRPDSLVLKELVNDVVKLYKANALQKEIEIVEIGITDLVVYSDRNITKLVLRNLFSNAIKFTPSGGRIQIKAIEFENQIQISVIDNGVGISNNDFNNIFDIEKSTSTIGTNQEKGTGLGLLLCKEFVDMQGGVIWVESNPNGGSNFSFTLPKYSPK